MSKYSGRDVKVGVGKEVSRGTPEASDYWLALKSFDFEDKATVLTNDQGYGVIEGSVNNKVVNKWAEGSMSGIVTDDGIGLLLYNVFGSSTPTSASPTASMYTHTFGIAQSHQHNSLTIEVDEPVVGNIAYPLAMINTFEINASLNEYVMFTANMLALGAVSTPVTASYNLEETFCSSEMKAYFADDFGSISAETLIKSAVVTIEKDVEKDDVLGTTSPDDFINKTVRSTVVIEKDYEDTTFRELFLSGSPQALRLTMAQVSGTPVALTFNFNQVIMTDWVTVKDNDGINKETLTFNVSFKVSESKMIEAELANTVASYPV